jgi:hypothetical protein
MDVTERFQYIHIVITVWNVKTLIYVMLVLQVRHHHQGRDEEVGCPGVNPPRTLTLTPPPSTLKQLNIATISNVTIFIILARRTPKNHVLTHKIAEMR